MQRLIQLSNALKHDTVQECRNFVFIFIYVCFDYIQKFANLDIALNDINDQGVAHIGDLLRENQVIIIRK